MPTLSLGNVVIIDNFGFHKSERAEPVASAAKLSLLKTVFHSLFRSPYALSTPIDFKRSIRAELRVLVHAAIGRMVCIARERWMFILIITVMILGTDGKVMSGNASSVEGFRTKEACETAAKKYNARYENLVSNAACFATE